MKNHKYKILTIISLFCLLALNYQTVYSVEENNQSTEVIEIKEIIQNKLNFDEVLKLAKEHSYDLKISDYNILISQQGIRNAKSEYFPKLNFGAGTEYTRNFRDISDSTVMSIGDAFINPYTRFQSILGVTVSYNLFDFGVRGNNLKAAKEDAKIKELETKEKLQELYLTLLDSYTKILVTTKQIEINNEILKLEEKNLELKTRLYKAKEISKTELDDEKVKISNIKTKISELKSIRAESLNWIRFYTGLNYDNENLTVNEIKKANFDVLEFKDYTRSIVWQIHEKNIKKKELELKVAKSNYLPKLSVYGKYYLYGSDYNNYGKSLGIEPSNFSVGASLNMPIFDGFKNSSNVQKTELELKQLYVERDKAIAQLATRLANMRSNLIYLEEQISENNNAISILTDKEKAIHKLVSKKLASPIEENDAKIELLNKKIELEKNTITQISITKGVQILTEEN